VTCWRGARLLDTVQSEAANPTSGASLGFLPPWRALTLTLFEHESQSDLDILSGHDRLITSATVVYLIPVSYSRLSRCHSN
jgi:hypothetical protein